MAVTFKTDTEMQRDVLEELDWDPKLEAHELGVEVDDGVVTLSGTVDSFAKKYAAERAAFRVDGVRAVANMLTIHIAGAKPNDTDIARMAADALEVNRLVPLDHLDITVKNGNVTLSGTVKWEYQRRAAVTTIRDLVGVRDVINLVTIEPPTASAHEVKQGIERALVRAAEVDAGHIHVRVVDGHVRLTGTVRSWPEKQAAFDAAWRAKGVTHVEDDIIVRPR